MFQVGASWFIIVEEMCFTRKHKMQYRWENIIYVILEHCYGQMPVYKIKPHDGGDKL